LIGSRPAISDPGVSRATNLLQRIKIGLPGQSLPLLLPPQSHLPGLSSGLHVVRQRDVVGPDVVLPLPQPEDATEDTARMEADPHAKVDLCGLHNRPGKRQKDLLRRGSNCELSPAHPLGLITGSKMRYSELKVKTKVFKNA
jgi:hypothetical protein